MTITNTTFLAFHSFAIRAYFSIPIRCSVHKLSYPQTELRFLNNYNFKKTKGLENFFEKREFIIYFLLAEKISDLFFRFYMEIGLNYQQSNK
jgi:hypothetical protein